MKTTIVEKYEDYSFVVEAEQHEGGFSCKLPAYNIFFSAKNDESVRHKARVMVQAFFKFNEDCFQTWKEVNKEEIEKQNTPEAKAARINEMKERFQMQ